MTTIRKCIRCGEPAPGHFRGIWYCGKHVPYWELPVKHYVFDYAETITEQFEAKLKEACEKNK